LLAAINAFLSTRNLLALALCASLMPEEPPDKSGIRPGRRRRSGPLTRHTVRLAAWAMDLDEVACRQRTVGASPSAVQYVEGVA
jgi:hypothetical protein